MALSAAPPTLAVAPPTLAALAARMEQAKLPYEVRNIENEAAGLVIVNAIHYVQSKNSKEEPIRLYYNGEYDSQQTKFEELSNIGAIAVSAASTREAAVLLAAARVMIDDNASWLLVTATGEDDYDLAKMGKAGTEEMVDKIRAYHEDDYICDHVPIERLAASCPPPAVFTAAGLLHYFQHAAQFAPK